MNCTSFRKHYTFFLYKMDYSLLIMPVCYQTNFSLNSEALFSPVNE